MQDNSVSLQAVLWVSLAGLVQVQLDRLCGHACKIVGRKGTFWPLPTFVVTAADQPGAPLEAKSATGAWNAVLARINASINARCGCVDVLG